jgi:hypothetical protein
MNPTEVLSEDTPLASTPTTVDRSRFFYVGAATVLLGLAVAGFHQFYLHGRAYGGRELAPPIRTWLLLHGISMSAWMLLFLVQPWLIVSGHRRVHMRLGWVGAVLAIAVVGFGWQLGIAAARVNPPEVVIWGLGPAQFLVVPIFAILLFGGFVAAGVWYRKQRRTHRSMMLLAMLAALPAALDRIDALRGLYDQAAWGAIFGPATGPLILGLAFIVIHRLLAGTWEKALIVGYAILAVISAAVMPLAVTSAWARVAAFLMGG